jgi:hypothetical protein
MRQPVERALKNEGSGHAIDDFGAFGARGVLRQKLARDGGRREPLVPIDKRQADDESNSAKLIGEFEEPNSVFRESGTADRFQGRSNSALDVGERKPNGFAAEINTNQALQFLQTRLQILEINHFRCHFAYVPY